MVRKKEEDNEETEEEKKEMSRSWGRPVLALPLIAPRPDDSFSSDAFRDVEGKLGLPSISKKGEFSASITDAPAAAAAVPMAPTMTRGFLSQPALGKTEPGKGKG